MARNLLIHNIGRLQSARGSAPLAGERQGDNFTLDRAAVLIEGGRIAAIYGEHDALPENADRFDAGGRLCTPGLVDAHTHLVFGGWRQYEIPLKLAGASYLDILKAGGGILSTVTATRAAARDELRDKARGILDTMLSYGVTTAEAKSGYGLDLETELKQLEVIAELDKTHPVDLIPTYLGAHAVPPEYRGDPAGYADFICDTVLPEVARRGLARYCDVFCEDAAFDVAQSRKVLLAARAFGLEPKIHADEITAMGGAALAGELRALSAEHLIATDRAGIGALAAGGVIAVLLPQTSFYLDKGFAPARDMIAAGVPVALASDFNPGSCPSCNLQLSLNLAMLRYKMTPAEVLTAATLNAACAVGEGERIGTVEVGKKADLVLWDAPDFEMVVYRFGVNQASQVFKNGALAWEAKK